MLIFLEYGLYEGGIIMSENKKNRSAILKKGIKDSVLDKTQNSGDSSSKQMTAEEVARIFEQDEVEALKQEYACLDETPAEIETKINEEVIGQEDVISKIVHVAYYNQMANFIEDCGYEAPKRINMILIGPTGCGKTSSINALKKYFKVPVAKYSSDSITSAGYIGNKVEDILIRLFEESKRNLALAERGIIFIDEIDKKVEQISSAGKDINGKAVQEELLKILEPNVIDLVLQDKSKVHFSTERLTVILGGAFVGLDKCKTKRLRESGIGFKASGKQKTSKEIEESEYISEDIIEYGFIPEFVGRLVMIGEFRKLNSSDILKIIMEGKNSPYIEKTRFLADHLNVEQQISKKFLEKIAEELAEGKTGARALESKMTDLFYPIIQDAFEHKGEYGMCFIDEDGHYELMYDDITYYG